MYPVRLWMTYPERLSRLSTGFRLILAIPVAFFLYLFQGGVTVAIWAAILVSGRIPRWLFDFEVGYNRFSSRAFAYFLLLTDQYPAFEGDWLLQYWVDYPERISRWRLFFWKLITSIPHIIVLAALWVAVFVVTVIAWFAILFTGKYPRDLHEFVVGVLRWGARVSAYATSLTDVFPPYSTKHDAGPGGAATLSAVGGGALLIAAIAGGAGAGVAIYRYVTESETTAVRYDAALAGSLDPNDTRLEIDDAAFVLADATDPATFNIITPRFGHRLVEFTVEYSTGREFRQLDDEDIQRDTLRLRTREDDSVDPVLLTVDGVAAPVNVPEDAVVELRAIFEIEAGDVVEELRGYPNARNARHVAWRFE
jgi:hypothetical protein